MTPQDCQDIIEKLAKPLTFEGEELTGGCIGKMEKLFEDVLIGAILFGKSNPTLKDKDGQSWAMNPQASKLIALWEPFGDVSLQEILRGGVRDCSGHALVNLPCSKDCSVNKLTPQTENLFTHLKEIL